MLCLLDRILVCLGSVSFERWEETELERDTNGTNAPSLTLDGFETLEDDRMELSNRDLRCCCRVELEEVDLDMSDVCFLGLNEEDEEDALSECLTVAFCRDDTDDASIEAAAGLTIDVSSLLRPRDIDRF
jgi:hypothetical protein